MRHRHPGPKVRYHTRRNNVRYRKRPLHPKTGSWISKKYIHGPRVKQPNEFKDVYTVSQDWARKRHLKINPPDKESRIKVGTLKDNGLAVQSYITPLYKFKDKPYPYLRKRFGISKYGDDDKDKVPNYKDCRPWDKKRQDVEEKFRMERDISRLQEEIDELGEPQWSLNKTRIQLENALHLVRMRLKSGYDIDPETMNESQIAERLSWVKKPAWEREPEKYPGLAEDSKRLREEGYYGDEMAEDISEAVEEYNQLKEELNRVTEEINNRADKITQKKVAIDETEQLIQEGIWR